MDAPELDADVAGLAPIAALPLEGRVAALTEAAQRLEEELETTDTSDGQAPGRPRA